MSQESGSEWGHRSREKHLISLFFAPPFKQIGAGRGRGNRYRHRRTEEGKEVFFLHQKKNRVYHLTGASNRLLKREETSLRRTLTDVSVPLSALERARLSSVESEKGALPLSAPPPPLSNSGGGEEGERGASPFTHGCAPIKCGGEEGKEEGGAPPRTQVQS